MALSDKTMRICREADRPITEHDLRMPEFRGVDIADLERREDGTIARKDRWERGIREIAGVLGMSREAFEVVDVVNKVREMREALTVDHKGAL